MSRVFFLATNTAVDPYPVYPLGMAVVAGALQRAGHRVEQYDYLAMGRDDADLKDSIKACRPDVVCVSIRNVDDVDSFSPPESAWFLAGAKRLLDLVRQEVAVPIIVGGPAFSIMPEEILDYLEADYGVVGEGEAQVCRVVEDLAAGRTPVRISSPAATRLAGEQMTSPLWDARFMEFYLAESGMVNLQTKRGCPHQCTYCTYPELEGHCFRPRPPELLCEEIEAVKRDFGADTFFFTDSIFNDSKGHYLQVAEELIRREIKIRWCSFFTPRRLQREDLKVCKRAGLFAVELGTDAASDTTLAGMRKSFDFAEVEAVNEACVAEEIPCAHFIIFGGPGETPETLRTGLDNIARLEYCVVFGFSGIRIFPGTALHQQAVSEGVIDADTSLLKPVYYLSPKIDQEWMNQTITEEWARNRCRIFPPAEGQERMNIMRNFGYRGILWDQLIGFPKT